MRKSLDMWYGDSPRDADKIDIFFAVGKVTESEYQELIGMLHTEA